MPDLNVKPQKLRDDLTMIGHFTNFYQEIENEIVFDLDIKINRGDCLGYYGLARDLAVLYNIPLVTPTININQNNNNLDILVTTDNVVRINAIKISNLNNKPSPDWLSKFVRLHGTNSINTLVDLTNYIMFLYGIPCHAFDTAKSGEKLIWEMNPNYSEFTSLDGTKLKLDKTILMVNSPDKPLSLSFWGGESCAIDDQTTETIVELAVYNPTTVRQNSQSLKSTTEAGTRLEKFLDPELIPLAFSHLVKLIEELTQGQVSSSLFDYYPHPVSIPQINFDYNSPSTISGINIPVDFGKNTLKNLGCVIARNDNDEAISLITPPSIRTDITIPEDLSEEIIRFYGYNNIPTTEPLAYKKISNITPKIINLIEELKDKYVALGYDEVITWPLVSQPMDPKTVITTQNSINSESVYLRQSLIPSLKQQLDQYNRFKLPNPKFFEIGKIYYQEDGKYVEKFALTTYDGNQFSETILDDLPKPENYTPKIADNLAFELTSQIITLDANVTINEKTDPIELIKKYSALIDKNILWSMEITDIFENKYTFRVYYYNCDDKTAKKTHMSVFNLV